MSLQQRMIRKKTIVPWLFDFTLTKNQHSQVTDESKMKNGAKEELESTSRHNDEIMKEERFRMDAMREQERFHMAHNAIIISYDN